MLWHVYCLQFEKSLVVRTDVVILTCNKDIIYLLFITIIIITQEQHPKKVRIRTRNILSKVRHIVVYATETLGI